MQRANLGSRSVSRVGFGAMQLPGPGVFGPPRDRGQALAVLRRAVELGVDHIDTSQYYGPTVANELIREALHPYPDDLTIVTKVGARRDEKADWLPAQRPEELRRAVEDNLRTLDVEQLGVVNLRLMTRMELPQDQQVPMDDQLAVLAACRDEGKIGGIGVSEASVEEADRAHATVGIVCVQNAFNILDPRDRPVLDRCRAVGVAYVPYFPLGSGYPGMPRVTEDPAVVSVATRRGATPAQVGLAWLLAQGDHVLLIPGTSSVAHLEENTAAGDLELTDDDLAELDAGRG